MKNKLNSFTKSSAKDYKEEEKNYRKEGNNRSCYNSTQSLSFAPPPHTSSLPLSLKRRGKTNTFPSFSQFVTMLTIRKKSESWKLKKVLEEDEPTLRPYCPPPSLFLRTKKNSKYKTRKDKEGNSSTKAGAKVCTHREKS
ncbi:hypothetical protein TNIN_401521 [Trichonephila inaurata madagascariensis]|uniref:Uncharacterized protein n=1 Tax=Trichonephila inaurata madagascariensis TaxID=2747483 RepID=A0A8X6YV34_9ARAC|nr:hypothetical protein TNIN_401521 [Trichonephila inaurata madagascariensis]